MKKTRLILLCITIILGGCIEPFENKFPKENLPSNLIINNNIGIRLETMFVFNEVKVNIKTDMSGSYDLVVLDILKRVITKECINLKEGNNIITLYTEILPPAGYRLGLYTLEGIELGIVDFNKLN
jgi:hypothetical protein